MAFYIALAWRPIQEDSNIRLLTNAVALDPLSALNSIHGLPFTFDTSSGLIDKSYVDRLELRAANRALLHIPHNGTATPVPDPSETAAAAAITQELNIVRIDVLSLKSQLYDQDEQALDNVLKEETTNATQWLTTYLSNSNGVYRDDYVKINVSGKLIPSMIIPFLTPIFFGTGIVAPSPTIQEITEGVFFSSHPEHYQLYLGNITGINRNTLHLIAAMLGTK
ncbi:hypothetical protein N7526_007960 [Penicillium atrosanguineum]|nr:hypothetical protein N7526_007960 [Penicillium atrosanguineum]